MRAEDEFAGRYSLPRTDELPPGPETLRQHALDALRPLVDQHPLPLEGALITGSVALELAPTQYSALMHLWEELHECEPS